MSIFQEKINQLLKQAKEPSLNTDEVALKFETILECKKERCLRITLEEFLCNDQLCPSVTEFYEELKYFPNEEKEFLKNVFFKDAHFNNLVLPQSFMHFVFYKCTLLRDLISEMTIEHHGLIFSYFFNRVSEAQIEMN